jgi:hypothetical protein
MSQIWYYLHGVKPIGPFTLDELRQNLAIMPDASNVLVWGDEFPDWKSAGDVPEVSSDKNSEARPAALERADKEVAPLPTAARSSSTLPTSTLHAAAIHKVDHEASRLAETAPQAKRSRPVLRGFGGVVLFFVLYMLIASIIYATVDTISVRSFEGSTLGNILDLCAAVMASFFGVKFASSALSSIMKNYPGRGIGIAFVLWLVINYALHFVFFPERTDFDTYRGLVQSLVACVTTWFVFRLPPLAPIHKVEDEAAPETPERSGTPLPASAARKTPAAVTVRDIMRVFVLSMVGPIVLFGIGPFYYGYTNGPYWRVIVWALACTVGYSWLGFKGVLSTAPPSVIGRSLFILAIVIMMAVAFVAGDLLIYLFARWLHQHSASLIGGGGRV